MVGMETASVKDAVWHEQFHRLCQAIDAQKLKIAKCGNPEHLERMTQKLHNQHTELTRLLGCMDRVLRDAG